jgi:hypothetical protein
MMSDDYVRMMRERVEALDCEACESVKRIWGMPSATAPLCTHENYSCVKERQEVNALVKAAQRIRKLWEETDGFDPRLCDRSAALPRLAGYVDGGDGLTASLKPFEAKP